MKQIQLLPLDERIQRVKKGQSAYPEYIASVLRNFMETPIADYLARFEEAQARLRTLLSLPDCAGLTYRDAACRIHQLHHTDPQAAGEAACILANPMNYYYEHRGRKGDGA